MIARIALIVVVVVTATVGSTWAAPSAPRRPMIASRHAVWFPDGQRIAFESNLERPTLAYAIGEGVAFDDPGLDVYVAADDGTNLVNMTRDHPNGADIYPSVSPDGTRIAFLRREGRTTQLVVTDVDGSLPRVIVRDVMTIAPTWSVDGREIAFSACCEGDRTQRYAIGPAGEGGRRLAEGSSPVAWSPDGARIAFAGFPTGTPGVSVADRNGESLRVVAWNTETVSVSWSHDSALLAFGMKGTGRFELGVGVVAASGGPVTRMVDGLPRAGTPAWSPVDRRIAYAGVDLWTIDANSGASRLVAGEYGLQTDPVWSPDGERILFTTDPGPWSFPDVGSYLEVVRADGSGRTRITPKSPPATQTTLPVTSVVPPDRLSISSVTLRPGVLRRGETVTARVAVESRNTGNLVDGAEVFAYARPAAVVRVVPRAALTLAGTATIRLRLLRAPSTRRPIRLSFVASRPGEPRVTSVEYLTQIPVRR